MKIDLKKLKEGLKLSEELKKLGCKPVGYRLATPETRKPFRTEKM